MEYRKLQLSKELEIGQLIREVYTFAELIK